MKKGAGLTTAWLSGSYVRKNQKDKR